MPNSRIVNTPAQASAQNGATHQQVTVSSSAGTLASLGSFTYQADTKHVLVQVNGAAIRVTFDGSTDPTTTKGFRYASGKEAYWPIKLAEDAKLVAEGSNATLEVQELNYLG